MVLGLNSVAVTSPSDFAPASSKEFLDIQATIECGFSLKCIHDMTRTYSHRFRSSWSTADLLTVVSDRIARAFNKSGAAQAVARDISRAFDRV